MTFNMHTYVFQFWTKEMYVTIRSNFTLHICFLCELVWIAQYTPRTDIFIPLTDWLFTINHAREKKMPLVLHKSVHASSCVLGSCINQKDGATTGQQNKSDNCSVHCTWDTAQKHSTLRRQLLTYPGFIQDFKHKIPLTKLVFQTN